MPPEFFKFCRLSVFWPALFTGEDQAFYAL